MSALVTIDYSEIENFKYFCNRNNIKIIKMQFLENIKCEIELTEEKKKKLLDCQNNKDERLKIIEFSETKKTFIQILS